MPAPQLPFEFGMPCEHRAGTRTLELLDHHGDVLVGSCRDEEADVVFLSVDGLELVCLVLLADICEFLVQVLLDGVSDNFPTVFRHEDDVVFESVNACSTVLYFHEQPFCPSNSIVACCLEVKLFLEYFHTIDYKNIMV